MALIWVVEDDPVFAALVRFVLERDGHEVEAFADATSALTAAKDSDPDLLVLDVNLPDLDGFEVCRAFRACPRIGLTPIFVTTTRHEAVDRLRMLEIGADDFLVKPVDPLELSLRVRNRLKVSRRSDVANEVIRLGDLVFDACNREVEVAGKRVELTPSEAAVVRYLLVNPGRFVDVETLLVEALGYPRQLGNPDILRTHVRNIRAKIEVDAARPRRLVNRHSVGYRIQVVEPAVPFGAP